MNLRMAICFLGEFDVGACKDTTICPRHRDLYGIRWRRSTRTCSLPKSISTHKRERVKGDRGVTLSQARKILHLTGDTVAIGAGEKIGDLESL